ncbi:hypothetical protein [Chitinimonas koreensis]|uniref:hypothetical protein n=1 Tax=Chitinimonas koreensis TaxID=356302 RepID=UPI0004241D4B|nr:hypothetical protein [Chitinimonas koreensis]QNM94832.1 hypothetical protein H9L41_12900 [Chitinimonas koreensis]
MKNLRRYLRPPTPVPLRLWLISGVLIVATLGLAYQATRLAVRNRADQAALDRAQRSYKAWARDASRSAAQAADSRQRLAVVRAELSYPWPQVFQAVEKVSNPEVELLEFKPDPRAGSIALRGEARTHAALIDYLGRLSTQPGWREVHLTHQQDLVRDRLETVEFEIKAGIDPLAPR